MSKGTETRNRIIKRAAPLFNKHGIAGVSITDIMAATGLKKGGIYRHFASKEEIAIAAFDYNYQRISRRLVANLNDQPTPSARLTTFLQNFTSIPEVLDGGCAVLNTAVEHDDSCHAALRERARRATQEWHTMLVGILERGVLEGNFQPTIDSDGIATLYVAALEGGVMLTQLHADTTHVKQVVEGLLTHVRDSVLANTA